MCGPLATLVVFNTILFTVWGLMEVVLQCHIIYNYLLLGLDYKVICLVESYNCVNLSGKILSLVVIIETTLDQVYPYYRNHKQVSASVYNECIEKIVIHRQE